MPKFARPAAGEYDPYYQAYLDLVPGNVDDILLHLKRQGLVMMNMMSSTSKTSINGVMFMSVIGCPSSWPPDIPMVVTPGSSGPA